MMVRRVSRDGRVLRGEIEFSAIHGGELQLFRFLVSLIFFKIHFELDEK